MGIYVSTTQDYQILTSDILASYIFIINNVTPISEALCTFHKSCFPHSFSRGNQYPIVVFIISMCVLCYFYIFI